MKYNLYSPISLNLILLIKSFIMIAFIIYGNIGLGPDEAQYWTWSQLLDWGYYSKPPGIAWQIWLGTLFFGNTELGVRFFSVVFSYFLSLSTYYIAKSCNLRPQTAFWAGIVMALCPLGIMSSYLAITDVGMVLSWSLATLIITYALTNQVMPNYILLGFILLFGALFKWPIYLFWVLLLPFVYSYPYMRGKKLLWGVLISLIGLLPSLIWNASHDWVTFRHVLSTILGGNNSTENTSSKLLQGNFFDFMGSQAALLSPILFVILIMAFLSLFRKFKSVPLGVRFCGITSLIILSLYSILSLFQKIQGNWCDYAYPPAIVFLTWFACERLNRGLAWLKAGVILSCILSAFIFSIPFIQSHGILSSYPIPYKTNPLKHNVGWDQIKEILIKNGYNSKTDFLFSDKYQTTSIISFYGPNQKRAYFLNLHGIRKNQFSFWPSMSKEQVGKTGFFVLTENSPHLEKELSKHKNFYQNELKKYFNEVQLIGVFPLFESYGQLAKGMLIFKGINYNGNEPIEVDLY